MRQIQEKLGLLRVGGEFELLRVQVIGVQLYSTATPTTISLKIVLNYHDHDHANTTETKTAVTYHSN